ncbi:MAG: VWA domain-containing protein [Bryobacterales bacterium]|nr:VWA domain-containing protein [Bryobacterales bacterium]MBV9398740.1 VWA domain-containing protein [Bryobacterales bacterium]
MSFLNLSLGELLGIAGAISAGVVALYLLDRSKRNQVVATLRFWVSADIRTQLKHRRRIQQPWSLLLQLISLFLLVAAIAGPRLGIIDNSGRDHVLILDTSAWMGSRARQGTLFDEAREAARAYVRSLPSRDRVMLVRADALATPATPFESEHQLVEQAILNSQPGASALNLQQAFEYAERAQRLQSRRAGEIVYAGAGRVPEEQSSLGALPSNLRILPVGTPQENVGIRKVGLRRSPADPTTWDIFVVVRNYGARPHDVDLALQFAKSPAGEKLLRLKPASEEQVAFAYKASSAGYLEARLNVKDAFPQDDRALLELPPQASLRVAVYSSEPQLLRPLIAANPQVQATFDTPDHYDAAVKADVVVLDRFVPLASPRVNAILIEPPAKASPIPASAETSNVKLEKWRADTELGAGLRAQDVVLESAEIFTPASGDIIVAEAAAGPLIVARQVRGTKMVALGFHPGRASMKYQLATPLLMANILRWMAPDSFRQWEVQAGTVGTVRVPVDKNTDPGTVRVLDENQRPLPFTIQENTLQFFSGAPGNVSVMLGDREVVYSLTLPDVAEGVWTPPANVRRGVPRAAIQSATQTDVWPWLAVLGGLGLLTDWLLYGRSRVFRVRASQMVAPLSSRIAARVGWRRQERKAS